MQSDKLTVGENKAILLGNKNRPPLSYGFFSLLLGIIAVFAAAALAMIVIVNTSTDGNAIAYLQPGNGVGLSFDGTKLVLRYIPPKTWFGNRFEAGSTIPAEIGPWESNTILTSGEKSQLMPAPNWAENAVLGMENGLAVWAGASSITPWAVAVEDIERSTGMFAPEFITRQLFHMRFLGSNISETSLTSPLPYWYANFVIFAEPNYGEELQDEGQLLFNIIPYIPRGWRMVTNISTQPYTHAIATGSCSVSKFDEDGTPEESGNIALCTTSIQGSNMVMNVKLSADTTKVTRISGSFSIVAPLERT
jgi:hypothetical protein